jgi:signal transduction histidine kinase
MLMSISIAFWSLFLGFMFNSKDALSGLRYSRLLMLGANFIPITFYDFVLSLIGREDKKRERIILFMGCLMAVLLLFIDFTPLFIKGVTYKTLVKCYYPDAGPLFILHIIFYFALTSYAAFLMYRASKISSGQRKNQINYVFVASVVGFLGGSTTFPLWYRIQIPPLGSNFVWLYAIVITSAIIRYRLMDITVALTRTTIFIAVYTLVLGLPFAIAGWFRGWLIETLGMHWWIAPLGLMAALATVGPFIYIYVDRKAEERLLKEQRRYQETLKQASVGMTRIRNLRKLLDLITHIVTKTVKISYAAIYLYNKHTDEYVLQVMRDKGRVPIPKIQADNPLVSWILVKREPLVYEEVKRQMEDTNNMTYKLLEENMRLLTATVIIPSFLEDRFMGFIVLGDKMSGQIYTPEDLNVFQVLASQAALAIENAQFYEEAKEMQEQISQAEKMATVGTMADGLSHQINNRFYALSLIAGDTIDTIKMTDTSKCTPEVKEMIDQINHALERIQTNVVQGGEVVKGILKYTRKGDEGFDALELNQIIDNTLEMVQFKVKLSELDIIRDFNSIPKIKGNMVQLEEVFFNFIDNAYDAIVERRTMLKEPGYRGKITISAHSKDDSLEIIIEDNGMGIQDESNEKIFTPFFTTKTSARKGTGLGLYVIRRIITDTHKGKISFESAYKVGTRFIVELPIAK